MRLAVGFPRQVSVVVASIAFATARNVASSRLSLKIVNLLKALERNCMHDSFEQDCQDGVLVISMSYAHESLMLSLFARENAQHMPSDNPKFSTAPRKSTWARAHVVERKKSEIPEQLVELSIRMPC